MMSLADRFLELILTVVLIVGGYQFYFLAQRQRWREARYLETRFDAMVTFDPRWVWIYSGLYYPMMVIATWSLPSWEAFAYAVSGYLALLTVHCCFFVTMPVAIPAHWRETWREPWEGTRSMRFLDFVWSYDKLRNAMPSMHVSVAMMTDLVIWNRWPTAGHVAILFPILIAISAIKTKQHYIVDVIPGAVLGAGVFFAWQALTSW
jgi:membrane-associated phospholipid phosphatase